MLSKRLNDIIFILIVVIVIAGVVATRFIVLDQYDTRIENAERDIEALETEILSVSNLVEQNRDDQLMSMTEMHQYIPHTFNGNFLRNRVLGELELNGITDDTSFNRNVMIFRLPTSSFPSDSDFARISEDLAMYRVIINFNTDDLTVLNDYLDDMNGLKQYFVLQTLSYYPTDDNPDVFRVEIRYITFYS